MDTRDREVVPYKKHLSPTTATDKQVRTVKRNGIHFGRVSTELTRCLILPSYETYLVIGRKLMNSVYSVVQTNAKYLVCESIKA